MSMSESNKPTETTLDLWLDRTIAVGVLIFLTFLPFHLVIKQSIPGVVGDYWKEALLLLLTLLWGVRCVKARKLLLSRTSLDLPVLIYAAVVLLHLIIDRSGLVGLWGAYISILYLPLFFLMPIVLRRFPNFVGLILKGMIVIGTLLSIGAIIEFVIDKPLWPSVELTMRQGFPDMYVYGTHLRRVYFVFDSPTTLANTLAMILPLSVLTITQSKTLFHRIISSLSTVLIFTAILLTFSRGIWVALALAAVVVILIKVISERNWKFFRLALVGGLAGLAIVFGVWILTPITNSAIDQYSRELLPRAYETVPMSDNSIALYGTTPLFGKVEQQVWTIYDPIEKQDDQRNVLLIHPKTNAPTEVIYPIIVPEQGLLRFSIALSPEVWTPDKGDGVKFEIYIKEKESGFGKFVFIRYINPKANTTDRRWRNYLVDLSEWSGKEVYLSLITEAGPVGDYGFDWAGWADLNLGTVPEDYVAAKWSEPENQIFAHFASITDWANDESNRDRRAAWNTALSAWGNSPIWGNGLGTTGAAALRSMPRTAIVTESQPLKMAVEMGVPGLMVWALLWYVILRMVIRLYQQENQVTRKYLILGIMSSLLIVFIDGLVYQNLEAKQVNAYFWTLVGILAFLQISNREDRSREKIRS